MAAPDITKIESITHTIFLDPNTVQIGAGGYGEVYTNPDYIKYAIKKSKVREECMKWQREYKIQNLIGIEFMARYPHSLVVPIIPYLYKEEMGFCFIVMDRVCPLQGTPENISNLKSKTVHALLGSFTELKMTETRGIFIGRAQLKEYIDINRAAYDMATFISFVHYFLNYDGADLEYVIGKICGSDDIRIFVIDFGMVSEFSIRSAEMSITAVEYFPVGDTCQFIVCDEDMKQEEETISNIFWNRYFDMANNVGRLEEAREVYSKIKI